MIYNFLQEKEVSFKGNPLQQISTETFLTGLSKKSGKGLIFIGRQFSGSDSEMVISRFIGLISKIAVL